MAYLLAFACTCGLVGLLIPVAGIAGLVDYPGGRKGHARPTPLIGGLAMGVTWIAVMLQIRGTIGDSLNAYLWASLLLLGQGVLDDRHSLSAGLRLTGQVLAASIVVVGDGVRIESLGNLFGLGQIHLGMLAVPFTIFAIVGLINAFNMIDGLDGLAGSMILTVCSLLLVASWWSGDMQLVPEILVFVATTAGFLVWNLRVPGRRHARVFLGDAGSTWAGFTLACLTIAVTEHLGGGSGPMVAIWMLAVPVFDTVRLMLQRRAQRRSFFAGGTDHLHHILLSRGLSVNAVIGVMVALATTAGLFGLLLDRLRLPEAFSAASALVAFTAFYLIVRPSTWRRESST